MSARTSLLSGVPSPSAFNTARALYPGQQAAAESASESVFPWDPIVGTGSEPTRPLVDPLFEGRASVVDLEDEAWVNRRTQPHERFPGKNGPPKTSPDATNRMMPSHFPPEYMAHYAAEVRRREGMPSYPIAEPPREPRLQAHERYKKATPSHMIPAVCRSLSRIQTTQEAEPQAEPQAEHKAHASPPSPPSPSSPPSQEVRVPAAGSRSPRSPPSPGTTGCRRGVARLDGEALKPRPEQPEQIFSSWDTKKDGKLSHSAIKKQMQTAPEFASLLASECFLPSFGGESLWGKHDTNRYQRDTLDVWEFLWEAL